MRAPCGCWGIRKSPWQGPLTARVRYWWRARGPSAAAGTARETARGVGGYGYLIDDGGSGYALGRDILTAVVRAADGRGPATALTQAVFAALGVQSVGEIITWLYAPATGQEGSGGPGAPAAARPGG